MESEKESQRDMEQGKETLQAKLAATFYTFTQETSLHGIKKASTKEYRVYRRTIWWLILLTLTVIFLFTLIRGLRQYFIFPTNVNIRVDPKGEARFPAVTVCNNNQIRKSFIDRPTDPVARKWFDVYQPMYGKRGIPADLAEEVSEWLNATDAPTYYRRGAHLRERFIYDCEYQRKPVDCANLVRSTITLEGLCYTLSPKNTTQDVGDDSGLAFKIDIEQDEYDVYSNSQGFGVKLMIHEDGAYYAASSIVNLEPGKEVHIAVQPTETIWQKAPYNTQDCVDSPVPGYSKEGCEIKCSFQYFEDAVGCDFTGDNEKLRNCTMFERIHWARAAYEEGIKGGGISCGCGTPCRHSHFATHLSSMAYPSDFALAELGIEGSFGAKNLLAVTVYFEELHVVVTEQVAAYTFQSLLSDVGGLMGLCLGASVITLAETLELASMLLTQLCRNPQRPTNTK